MGADLSFYMKSIATLALTFFGYIISVLASVVGEFATWDISLIESFPYWIFLQNETKIEEICDGHKNSVTIVSRVKMVHYTGFFALHNLQNFRYIEFFLPSCFFTIHGLLVLLKGKSIEELMKQKKDWNCQKCKIYKTKVCYMIKYGL